MSTEQKTTIWLSREARNGLAALKDNDGETYEDVIRTLVEDSEGVSIDEIKTNCPRCGQ